MEIKRIAIDAVNEVIVMNVVHMDYKGQVQKRINEKMPLATVKGFRKGAVPKDLVSKQYGKPLKIEEVNKVVELALERYIASERLALLGTPLPKINEAFSWDNEELVFEFEIGLAPFFTLNLEGIEAIKYKIVADQKMIDDQVTRIQKQFGTLSPQDIIDSDSEVMATFVNQDADINTKTPFELSVFSTEEIKNLFIGKKVGDTILVNSKGLFADDYKLTDVFGVPEDMVADYNVDFTVTIEEINAVKQAELNKELFDATFGPGTITSEAEMRAKIQNDAEQQLAQQTEQKLTDDVVTSLIKVNNFDLPKAFLIKWLQQAGEKKLTPEQAETEYNRSENGLRYQMIEGRIIAQSETKITFEDLKKYTAGYIRQQMAQYGQTNPTDQEVEGIVAKILANQDEVKRLSQEVMKQKTLENIVSKATITEKELSLEQFIKEVYGQ